MKHLDLFSGIGGFALAAQRVWGEDHEIVGFCDNNKFCQQVLKKHWPEVKIYGDIKKLTKKRFIADAEIERRREARKGVRRSTQRPAGIDLLTGGFPCQPFSHAGKRRGKDDNRYLWPQMLQVIREFNPRWIIAENVAGLLSMVQPDSSVGVASQADLFGDQNEEIRDYRTVAGDIDRDLREAGYETHWLVIPACAVGAPHRRDRVWIVAHSQGGRHGRCASQECGEKFSRGILQEKSKGRNSRSKNQGCNSNAPNARRQRQTKQKQQTAGDKQCNNWDKNWLEVATRLCGVDDGLPVRLDGFKLTKSKHREERLKALGNAIVPQVAFEIMKAIKNVVTCRKCLSILEGKEAIQ